MSFNLMHTSLDVILAYKGASMLDGHISFTKIAHGNYVQAFRVSPLAAGGGSDNLAEVASAASPVVTLIPRAT